MNKLPIIDPPQSSANEKDFISELLKEQNELSAVETFSEFHQRVDIGDPAPEQSVSHYSRLLPTTKPESGEQYAFEVDLDRCSGCKACVAACHSLNGLDESESWRDVGLLTGGTTENPILQHVTTACHHCVEPACMKGCPVNAYVKDEETGIVKHLDDQCFGCQYCTMACPYDVPKFHREKGIVRKCDMCSQRLQVGEPPACAQACPHEAISIKIVNQDDVIENSEADPFLPAAPNPQITFPTTYFKTSKVFPRNALPADYYSVNPQHPHWPLIIMLVLTQLSVGAFITSLILMHSMVGEGMLEFQKTLTATALGIGLLALGASTLHLGRPQYAFRAILGFGHSWLSREIVVFGAFAVSAKLFALANWLDFPKFWLQVLGWPVAIAGLAGILCSVMIYAATNREFWSFGRTLMRFAFSGAITGVAATLFCILIFGVFSESQFAFGILQDIGVDLIRFLILFSTIKLTIEFSQFRHLFSRSNTVFKRSAALLSRELSNSMIARTAFGILGGIIMPLIVLQEISNGSLQSVQVMIAVPLLFAACLIGEFLERFHFFAACVFPRMPGAIQ